MADLEPEQRIDAATPQSEAHILVVEDDAEMRGLVGRFLRENGFRVTGVESGAHMHRTLGHAPVDLILMDIMLPDRSGFDLVRDLRRDSQVPVIMLTARGDEADRVHGLEIGADDYIPKPFARAELLARVRALLRRARAPGGPQRAGQLGDRIRFGEWTLDVRHRELTGAGRRIVLLTGSEFDLLVVFCEHPQIVLSREQLLELARNRVVDATERAVDVMISRLRRKLEPHDDSPAVIKTVRGTGYVFVPHVTRS